MLFNSYEFAVLLALVLPAYILLRSPKLQNPLLLVSSYIFYGWWDYRFLTLLWISTLTDYFVALAMERTDSQRKRRRLVVLSCVVNLGLLGIFKYANLALASANGIGHWLGFEDLLGSELRLVLPMGISFYTFQTLSYTIDVYRRRCPATRSLTDFALYVSFFPQLVAGPIERSTHLIPMIQGHRRVGLSDFERGSFLFALGWFRKSLADVLGTTVDPVFADPAAAGAWQLLWALYAFAFQIYLDFSGYTDMARGVARWLGFDLMLNFRAPYLSSNIRDFWQRWHISLSTWLRDYLYIPLSGNRHGAVMTIRNLMLTMFLGGLWHGAAWNFAAWGLLHGVYLAVHRGMGRDFDHPEARQKSIGSQLRRLLAIMTTFHFTILAWLFFRVRPVGESGAFEVALDYLAGLGGLFSTGWEAPAGCLYWIGLVVVIDLLQIRARSDLWTMSWPAPLRGLAIAGFVLFGFILGSGEHRAFIYFQF